MPQTLRNPYEVLGIPRTADADEIKSAYRKLALQYHPDRNPGDAEAENRFKEISEAYATLRDPASRARFDRFGSSRPEASRPDFSTVDWQTVFQEADIGVDWSRGGGVPRTGNAVFDVLFGAMTGMMRTSGLLPGEDRTLLLEVNVREAREGTQRVVHVPGPSVCAKCGGRGVTDGGNVCPVCGGRAVLRSGSEVEVTVPPGVRDGVKLRLKGLGGPGRPPGDALVSVEVRLPPGVERVGRDLRATLPLTPGEAARGERLELLGVEVTVPPGAEDGQTVRVPGGGLGGDLVVILEVGLWSGLGRRLRDTFLGMIGRE